MLTERPTKETDPCRFSPDPQDPYAKRCRSEIVLGATVYRCARFAKHGEHDGVHDANTVHRGDGGLTRW